MRIILLVFFLFIAKVNASAQTSTIDNWLEETSVGLMNFGGDSSDELAEDSLVVTTKYLYGSILRAFGQAVPQLADLTKRVNLVVVGTTNAMPRKVVSGAKSELIEGLKKEGLSEWMSLDGAEGDMTLYASEDDGLVTAFVFLLLNSTDVLTVVDFDGKADPDVLMKLMQSDPEILDNLLNIGDLDLN